MTQQEYAQLNTPQRFKFKSDRVKKKGEVSGLSARGGTGRIAEWLASSGSTHEDAGSNPGGA